MNLYNQANFDLFKINKLNKINKSNAKVSTHYRFLCLYAIIICYDVSVSYKVFNFFWNVVNSKANKIVTLLPFTYKAIH